MESTPTTKSAGRDFENQVIMDKKWDVCKTVTQTPQRRAQMLFYSTEMNSTRDFSLIYALFDYFIVFIVVISRAFEISRARARVAHSKFFVKQQK